MFFPANEKAFLKHNHQLDFKASKKKTLKFQENEVNFFIFFSNQLNTGYIKYLYRIRKSCIWATKFCDFNIDVIKKLIELHVVQFWSEIKLVISNQTCTVHLFEFEITKMMSDWIAPLSSMTIMNPTGVLIKDTNKKQFWLILCANSDQIVFIPSPSFPLP